MPGALFFGDLTDRFGRKRLFLITLTLYLPATVATAFSTSALVFRRCRFSTGTGIGGVTGPALLRPAAVSGGSRWRRG